MTTPSGFKIVSLSTPSAFEPNQKANLPQCGTLTLPLNTSPVNTIVYGGNGALSLTNLPPLNLAGICKVVLPDYGIQSGIPLQYRIQNVTGLVPGQSVLFINNNNGAVPKYFAFDFITIPNNISYSPNVIAGTKVLKNTPVIGLWNTTDLSLQYVTATVTNGGSGYTTAPTVNFSGGGPNSATATVTVVAGSITAINSISSGGTGYIVGNVSLIGTTGANATATVTTVDSFGAITGLSLPTNAGTGYPNGTGTVSLLGPPTTIPIANATVAAGTVTGINITNNGSGFYSTPGIVFSGGGGSGAAATSSLNPVLIVNGAVA